MHKIILSAIIMLAGIQTFAATKYNFTPETGMVEFKTKGWPNLITIKGKGTGVTGGLVEDQGTVTGQLTFDLTTLKTGISLRDDHMKNNYLEVKEHPTAELKLDKLAIPKDLSGDVELTGTLKLHGVEKPIKGTAVLSKEDGSIKVDANFIVMLSDFKIAIPSYKGITVAEKVTIAFNSTVKAAQ